MSDRISEIRRILRKPLDSGINKFALLKDVAELVSTGHPLAQDFVLRVFARKHEFNDFHDIVIELVKQVGLYRHLDNKCFPIFHAIYYIAHEPLSIPLRALHHC